MRFTIRYVVVYSFDDTVYEVYLIVGDIKGILYNHPDVIFYCSYIINIKYD